MIWWILMGALLISFLVALLIADDSPYRCAWCGDSIPEGEDARWRRPYRLHTLETTLYGLHLYCSRGCALSHAEMLEGSDV